MKTEPLVLGLNRTQDGSACLMQGSTLLWAIQKERLSRQKHHWGKPGDLHDLYRPRLPGLDQQIDVLVECYSSDSEFKRLAEYEQELAATLRLAPDCRRAFLSHHLAHLYSVLHPSPFRDAAVMIMAGLGMFYFLLTQAIFPGEGNEGKVMGLAPHGSPGALGLPPLEIAGSQVQIPAAWRETLRQRERFRYAGTDVRFADIANLAAAGQRAFEEAVLELARWLHRQTGADNLCFAGGTGLNCSANDRLLRETPFRRVFIPPAPNDAGTALGCAVYGLTELAGERCDYRWRHDYLGPEPQLADIEAALAGADDLVVERIDAPDELCARIAKLLCAAKVVALYQGRSEFGPRALGHRSILGDPRNGRMRDWINAEVKQREWFRPLAPVVLLDRAEEYFDICRPSPFMQFAAPVRERAAAVPAITHVDRSARLQTVGPDDDPFLWRLLTAFEERTGVPVLLNTSFNRKDEPIVETPAEALATFRDTPLHALAMPPFLVRKRIEPGPVS